MDGLINGTIACINDKIFETLDRSGDALVEISSRRHDGGGVVWSEGLIVTNAHVVGRGPVTVRFRDGTRVPPEVIACSREADLAALQVHLDRGGRISRFKNMFKGIPGA